MRVHIVAVLVIFLSCLTVHAYAEDTAEIAKFMSEDGTGDFNETLWKLRITNHMVIGKQKVMNDFAQWCSWEAKKEDSTNHKPCEILSQEGVRSEEALIEAIPVVKVVIKKLEAEPQTEQNIGHLAALNEQLQTMEKMPTPLHSIADAVLNKDQK